MPHRRIRLRRSRRRCRRLLVRHRRLAGQRRRRHLRCRLRLALRRCHRPLRRLVRRRVPACLRCLRRRARSRRRLRVLFRLRQHRRQRRRLHRCLRSRREVRSRRHLLRWGHRRPRLGFMLPLSLVPLLVLQHLPRPRRVKADRTRQRGRLLPPRLTRLLPFRSPNSLIRTALLRALHRELLRLSSRPGACMTR